VRDPSDDLMDGERKQLQGLLANAFISKLILLPGRTVETGCPRGIWILWNNPFR
jgi:hypothetical protein